jgi:tetratricopeptide (TPR) repeat protein
MYRFFIAIFLGSLLLTSTAKAQTKEEQAALDLERAGKTDEAIAAFNNIIEVNPSNANVLNELSALYYVKDDYANSYRCAGEALKLQNNEPRFMVSRARAALELEKPDETLTLTEKILTADPSIAYAQLLRGKALYAKDQKQQAIAAFSKAIGTDPTMESAYWARGAAFYDISRYGDALKDFDKFLQMNPEGTAVYNQRGMTQSKLGNREAAIADFGKSIEHAAGNYFALANRGMLLIDGGQLSGARADFEKALSYNDKHADAYYGLARVYNKEKSYDKALSMATKSLAINATSSPYNAEYIRALLGLDRDKEAITAADKMLAANEANSDAWLLKATAYNNMGDFATGITTLNTAIAKMPDNYLFYSLRASLYRGQKNEQAAAADDQKAKELAAR